MSGHRAAVAGRIYSSPKMSRDCVRSAGVRRGDLEPSEPWPSATMLYTGNAPTRRITPDLTVSRSLYNGFSAVKESQS